MTYQNHLLTLESAMLKKAGSVSWKSPSNLAIIKYWGKHGVQLPRNPSISFTLSKAYTKTTIQYSLKEEISDSVDLDFYFEGKSNELFHGKVERFMNSLLPIFPFLKELKLTIDSHNSFPHSAGIASSASAMSALALCLCDIERKLFKTLQSEKEFLEKASYIARLGSGSACRSVYPGMAVWGKMEEVKGSSDVYAVPYKKLHPVFSNFQDAILIVSKKEKSVSSRAGHALMEGNIYAANRYRQATQRLRELLVALEKGDVDKFGEVAENEALTLHALMMASEPSYLLMRPNTIAVIEAVRAFREETGVPLYFSLDAGPNPHLLYPYEHKSRIELFIKQELIQYCEDGKWIADEVG